MGAHLIPTGSGHLLGQTRHAAAQRPRALALRSRRARDDRRDGRYERVVDDRFRAAWQFDEARRLVTLAYGAGQWAALDVEGRLLLSRNALESRYNLADSLRFVQLAGSSSELVATTSESQVLSCRCAPDSLASAPVLDVRWSGSPDAVAASFAASTQAGLSRAQDAQQAYSADVTASDLLDGAGTTTARHWRCIQVRTCTSRGMPSHSSVSRSRMQCLRFGRGSTSTRDTCSSRDGMT